MKELVQQSLVRVNNLRTDVEEVKWENMRWSVGKNYYLIQGLSRGLNLVTVTLFAFVFLTVVGMELRPKPPPPKTIAIPTPIPTAPGVAPIDTSRYESEEMDWTT
jgi:hypothetical protein